MGDAEHIHSGEWGELVNSPGQLLKGYTGLKRSYERPQFHPAQQMVTQGIRNVYLYLGLISHFNRRRDNSSRTADSRILFTCTLSINKLVVWITYRTN